MANGNDPDPTLPELPDHLAALPYHRLAFKASHNSFGHDKPSLKEQLDRAGDHGDHPSMGCRGMELDLHQADDEWRWSVAHLGGYEPEPDKQWSHYLEQLGDWASDNPDAGPVTVHLDVKSWWDRADYAERLDEYLLDHFDPDRIYRQSDLRAGAPSLVEAARAGAWPTAGELRGKWIFCLSGSGDAKERYSGTDPASRVCFVDMQVAYPDSLGGDEDRGEVLFLNVSCNVSGWRDAAVYASSLDGFVVRAFMPDTGRKWKAVQKTGVNLLATDAVDAAWASVGPALYAPTPLVADD